MRILSKRYLEIMIKPSPESSRKALLFLFKS